MAQSNRKRPRPRQVREVTLPHRFSMRVSDDEKNAIELVRHKLAESQGKDPEKVSFSDSARFILTQNLEEVMEATASPGVPTQLVDVPDWVWEMLTAANNKLSHAQGSAYTIMRKLNFEEDVAQEEVFAAADAIQESKASIERMEDALLTWLHSQQRR